MLANGIKETTATTGIGTVTMSAVTGYARFANVFAVGALVKYAIQSGDGASWEWGIGTVGAANTLFRTDVMATYSAGTYTQDGATAISLSGTSTVMVAEHSYGSLWPYSASSDATDRYSVGHVAMAGSYASQAQNTTEVQYGVCVISRPYKLTGIGIAVITAAAAGSLARLAVYAANASGKPGALIVDAGTVATDSTGYKNITLGTPVILMPGLYFLTIYNNGLPTLRGLTNAALPYIPMSLDTYNGGLAMTGFRATGQTFGAYPDPAPAVADQSNVTYQVVNIKGHNL